MSNLKVVIKLWLRLQCQMIPKTSAAILVKHQVSASDEVWARRPEAEPADILLLDIAREVIRKQRLHLQPVEQGIVIGQPVVIDGQFWGALVVRVEERAGLDLQAMIKLLQWGITWLQFLLYQQQVEAAPPNRSTELLELLSGILRENSLQEAAISLVNKLATYSKSARVSFGLCARRGVDLVAVSFSANFDKRTEEMQQITAAMNEAVEQRQDIHYLPDTALAGPNGESLASADSTSMPRCHERLQQGRQLSGVHSFLLRRDNQILGIVTLEVPLSAPLTAETRHWVEQNLALLAPVFSLRQTAAMSNAQALKHSVSGLLQRTFGHQHLRGKIISVGLIGFLMLQIVPGDYRVHSDAIVENTNKYVLVAPQDGYLAAINARPGDAVTKSALLAQMKDEDLMLERRKLASQLQQYRQEYDNSLATANRSGAAIANAQIEQAAVQLRLLEQQLARINIVAPINGIIVSDDIRQSLGAPVKQGDLLFEIAAPDGYLVQLYVDERDITAIAKLQTGRLNLTSLPGQLLDFTVSHITPVSEVRDGRNYFRVEAQLIGETSLIRPGMTGSGKILVGRRALGWIWFHDVWHWLRLKLWL